jgi:ParB-like chromosome segregation protein Spo0J
MNDLFGVNVGAIVGDIAGIAQMPLDERVAAINAIRMALHAVSPFASEPVDCVEWVKADDVFANDYNPNSVAPPEMELLRLSIMADGYTQPIVTMPDGGRRQVVDGFHRSRVGKECKDVRERVHGYLPVVRIKQSQEDKADRMAATVRHNRARGEHRVDSMAEIVVELKRRFWSDEKIAKELGMEPDEVLRLTQVTGLAGLFADREFSEAWEAESLGEIEGEDSLDND